MRSLFTLAILALLAGCVAPGAAPADDSVAPATAAPTAAAATEQPFAFDGDFGPGLVACGPGTCTGLSPGKRWTDLDLDGTLTGANLTLTWTATTPAMQKLRLGISWGDEKDRQYEIAEGPSPVVLSLADLSIAPEDAPFVWVWAVTPVPMGVATATTPQTFHVEGTLTVAPKA